MAARSSESENKVFAMKDKTLPFALGKSTEVQENNINAAEVR
jgi:hypothetical protein